MLDNSTLEQVKQYNNNLKQYRAKSAQLTAEIEYINREIDNLCNELTAELGVQVTKENIEQMCKEQSEKIINSLQSGNAVLAKIASEEQNTTSVNNTQPAQPTFTQQVVQPTPVAPVTPITPVQQTMNVMQSNVVPQASVQGSVFNGQSTSLPNTPNGAVLPPLFNLGQ